MKATIIDRTENNGKIEQNRKEKHFQTEYVILVNDKTVSNYNGANLMRSIVTARIYATNAANYACIWIQAPTRKNHKSVYINGGGKANGYGYHRSSAALQAAINNAGVELSESIDGRGDGAMQEAMISIAQALGYEEFHLHIAHA